MSEKHDPEITPLPAPLPGLSVEIEAIQSDIDLPGVIQRPSPAPAKAAAAAPAKAAEAAPKKAPAKAVEAAPPPAIHDEKEKTDPELAPVAATSSRKVWWIIGGMALFALGVGSGSVIWQPSVSLSTQPTPSIPPAALPSMPSPPVEVTPIMPPPTPVTPPSLPTPTVTPLPPTTTSPVEATPTPTAPAALPMIPTTPTPPAATPPPTPETPPTTPPPTTPTTEAPVAEKGKPPKAPKGTPSRPKNPPIAAAPKVKAPVEAPPPPVAPPPPAVPSGPQKQLAQATIRQIMLGSESGWKSCVKDAFGSNLTISIGVSSTGQVQKADILGPLAQSSTGRCITGEIRKLHFPPFTEGGASKQFFWSYQIPAN